MEPKKVGTKMEHNLKNRPKKEGTRKHYSDRQLLDARERWFEGFEKELREAMEKDEMWKLVGTDRYDQEGAKKLAKVILGK